MSCMLRDCIWNGRCCLTWSLLAVVVMPRCSLLCHPSACFPQTSPPLTPYTCFVREPALILTPTTSRCTLV